LPLIGIGAAGHEDTDLGEGGGKLFDGGFDVHTALIDLWHLIQAIEEEQASSVQ
jgi:hypothetical protein